MEIDEFKVALENKRHQEIIALLRQSLEKNNGESKLIEEIVDINTKTLGKFIDKLDEISKETPADITVETNQDLVVKEIVNLAKELKLNIKDLKESLNQKVYIDIEELKPFLEKEEKVEEWVFDVKRDAKGYISTVTAREK
jgi:glutamine synthetase type III